MPKPALIALALLVLAPTALPAQTPHRTEPVRFAKGASSATVTGSIRADGGVDHVLVVRAGQTLKVSMRTRNASARFNIIAPGLDERCSTDRTRATMPARRPSPAPTGSSST